MPIYILLQTVRAGNVIFRRLFDLLNPSEYNIDGEEINTGLLKQKEVNTVWQQSFLGHAFRIRSVETNEVLLEFEVEFNSIHSIGRMINRDVPVPDVEAEVEYL